MSSYLHKSKKTFQPKAPAVRARPSASNTPSVRGSQEPSRQEPLRVSETPQPGLVESPTVHTINKPAEAVNVAAHAQNARQPIQVLTPASSIGPNLAINSNQDCTDSELARPEVTQGNVPLVAGTPLAVTSHGQTNTPPSTEVNDVGSCLPSDQATVQTASSTATHNSRAVPQAASDTNTQEEGANALLQLSQAYNPPHSSGAVDRDATEGSADERVTTTSTVAAPVANESLAQQGVSSKKPRKQSGKRDASAISSEQEGPADDAANEGKGQAQENSAEPRAKRQRTTTVRAKEVQPTSAGKSKAKAKSRPKVKRVQPPVSTEVGENVDAIPRKPARKASRKRKRPVTDTAADEEEEEEEEEGNDSVLDPVENARRKRREPTPEDAEEQRIDPNVVTMGELEYLKTGVRSTREGKLRERDEEARAKKQADAEIQSRIDEYGDEGVPETDLEAMDLLQRQKEEQEQEDAKRQEEERVFKEQQEWTYKPSGRYGSRRKIDLEPAIEVEQNGSETDEEDYADDDRPGMTIVVDGQIVQNPAYRVRQEENTFKVNEKQITDISNRVHEQSFRHPTKRFKWDELSTEKFYEGLRAFGMDFGMIATIIPGTSRMQVHSFWKKQEKLNGARVTEALLPQSRKLMPISDIEDLRGTKLMDPKKWEEEKSRREQSLRDEKEKERLDVEAALRGPTHDENDNNEHDSNANTNNNDNDNENEDEDEDNAAEWSGAEQNGDHPKNGDETDHAEGQAAESDGVVNSIEVGDEDSVVRSIEADKADATPARRGGKSKTSGRGRGRGQGRGRGRARTQA